MHGDPIVEEVRRVRQEYARQFNYDLQAMAADLQKREQQHPERLVSFPPKPPRHRKTASEKVALTGFYSFCCTRGGTHLPGAPRRKSFARH